MRRALVWSVPVVAGVLVAVMFQLSWDSAENEGVELFFGLAFVAYASMGALIASREPRNPVGWLFAALGVLSPLTEALYSYAAEDPGQPSAAVTAAAWVSAWAGEPAFVGLILLLLLFPDGHFVSTAWRRLGVATIGFAVVWTIAVALEPGPLRDVPGVRNPVGIEAAASVIGAVTAAAPFVFFLLVPVGVASVVARFRQSNGEQRQQIKWLVIAGLYAIIAITSVGLLGISINTDEGLGDILTALLVASAITVFPVAAAIAILRHRLYDIDVVIKRTVVYGVLTALLVATYLGSVLLFRLVLNPVTGESDLAVAASTLAVAALFRPLRSRVQAVVDRRFYRRRYDAARTIEGFAGRLRHELDLETLGTDLRAVVDDTMQPTQVSLWLRSEP